MYNYVSSGSLIKSSFRSVEAEPSEVPIEWRLEGIRLVLHNNNPSAGINNASTLANEVLRLHPQNPEVLTTRALVLFLNNKLSQALQHLASALRFDPSLTSASTLRRRIKNVESTKEEGNVLFKSGKWEEAVTKYDECLDLVGTNEDEAKGGQVRGMLLSNKATTLLKVRSLLYIL
jgi:DnaJ family protein C protein 7